MSNSKWKQDPSSSEWSDPSNWQSGEVPTSTAYFSTSYATTITFSSSKPSLVDEIYFDENASGFTFAFTNDSPTPALIIQGKGVVNKYGTPQCIQVAAFAESYKKPQLQFKNGASAGSEHMTYYAGPASLETGTGGGVIAFSDESTAGSANFLVKTGPMPPPEHSTVGGEISFDSNATAGTARFTVFGSVSTADQGDTFGNVVFHGNASAARGHFTNIGGTVKEGDGGNTQFYDSSTADHGVYNNYGGTFPKANGGDVAFDGNSTAAQARVYNHAAPTGKANGGVTSFNNNWPQNGAASAGHGQIHNYGANAGEEGSGGHTEFSARYGSPSAANATIFNYGTEQDETSCAGHTIFSVTHGSGPASEFNYQDYYPKAGQAVVHNYPGKHGGYTEFTAYSDENSDPDRGPMTVSSAQCRADADQATFHNHGADVAGESGGVTKFYNNSSANHATLIAYAGTSGGGGGQIEFGDHSDGGTSTLIIYGDDDDRSRGTLSLGYHTGEVNAGTLVARGGVVQTQLGGATTTLNLSAQLKLKLGAKLLFNFYVEEDQDSTRSGTYTVLRAPNLSEFSPSQFGATNDFEVKFEIVGNELNVSL